MDITALGKWQLLSYLLHKAQRQTELSKVECQLLHELQTELVGEAYQQIALGYPAQGVSRIRVVCTDTSFRVLSGEHDTVVSAASDEGNIALSPLLLQSDIVAVDIDAVLLQRLLGSANQYVIRKPSIAPAPFVTNRKTAYSRGRKWRKFKRDPLLFVADFFKKIGRKKN